tara:strand:+ start:100 stop:1710 length:1611 start_codon:yes stop_codon:yes gene_type:complete
MKVPVYESKAPVPTQGTGRFLTAQLDAGAMMAPGRMFAQQGEKFAQVGNEIAEFGFKKAQIGAESEALGAQSALQLELADLETQTLKNPNMSAAEQQYRTGSRVIIDKYSKTMSSSLARRSFAASAAKVQTQGLLSFSKLNNARVVAAANANLTVATDSSVKIAANLSLGPTARISAAVSGQVRIGDSLGDIGAAEVQKRSQVYYEDLVENTLAAHINVPGADVLTIVQQFREGNLADTVLQSASANLTPEKLSDIAKDATKQANDIIKLQTSLREQKEEQANQANDALNRSIVNVDRNDPSAVEQAKDDLDRLRSANYFTKPSQVDALLRSLESESEGGAFPKKSAATDDAEADLEEKESLNQLSYEELLANKDKVTRQWYTGMLNTLEQERGEAETDAINEFKATFRYTELADRELIGTPSRQAYLKSTRDIRRFIRANPGVSYRDVMAEADRLIKLQKPRFEAQFQQFKTQSLIAGHSLLTPTLKGKIPNPATASLEEVQQAVAAELAAGSTDMLLLGFNNTLNKAFDLRIFD